MPWTIPHININRWHKPFLNGSLFLFYHINGYMMVDWWFTMVYWCFMLVMVQNGKKGPAQNYNQSGWTVTTHQHQTRWWIGKAETHRQTIICCLRIRYPSCLDDSPRLRLISLKGFNQPPSQNPSWTVDESPPFTLNTPVFFKSQDVQIAKAWFLGGPFLILGERD